MNLHDNDESTLFACVVIAIVVLIIYYLAEPFFYRPLPSYDNVINVRILDGNGKSLLRQPSPSQ